MTVVKHDSLESAGPLELRHVSLRAGAKIRVHPVSLTLAPGTVTSILGANGSGKSSLLQLMSADLKPTTGQVIMQGTDVSELSSTTLARLRALLAQETDVAFPFLVHEVVSWGRFAWRRTSSLDEDERIINSAIEAQGLSSVRERRVNELSGGERSRVHLARVIAQQTPLLMLDEADAALDLVGRRKLDDTIGSLVSEGRTAVVVSHDINRVARMSDRLIVMCQGRLHADGKPSEVLTSEILSEAFGTTVEVSRGADLPVVHLPHVGNHGSAPEC